MWVSHGFSILGTIERSQVMLLLHFPRQRETTKLSKLQWQMTGSFASQLTTGRCTFQMCVPVVRQRLSNCTTWSNALVLNLVCCGAQSATSSQLSLNRALQREFCTSRQENLW